ncbi:MAG: acetyltransferase [bacterium]|nr:acetyltransferase [bacterium]MDD3805926.1 acetyltransferase [bacterium]MDD4557665.1 acetyltransferase [bacterium]
MTKDKQLCIIGIASSYTAEVIEIAEATGYRIAVLIDNLENGHPLPAYNGYITTGLSGLPDEYKCCDCACAVTTPHYRHLIIQQAIIAGFSSFPQIAHPSACISKTVTAKDGLLLNAGAVIASGTQIGRFCIINRSCSLGHHNIIGDYVTLSPAAVTTGGVIIKDSAYVGAGAIILPGVTIGSNAIVGAGAVVREDVPDSCLAAGVPAVIKRTGIEGYRGR